MADYRQILRKCTERLIPTADRLTVNGSNTSEADRGSNAVNAATAEDSVPSALEEHRRIFGYRPPVGSVQRVWSSTSCGKQVGGSPYFIPRNTWTRSFVCLAKKDSRSAPSVCERIALSARVETRPMCMRKLLKHFQHSQALEGMRSCELLMTSRRT